MYGVVKLSVARLGPARDPSERDDADRVAGVPVGWDDREGGGLSGRGQVSGMVAATSAWQAWRPSAGPTDDEPQTTVMSASFSDSCTAPTSAARG